MLQKTKLCEDCGCEIPKTWVYVVCDSCLKKRRLKKVKETLTLQEYLDRNPNAPLFDEDGDPIWNLEELYDRVKVPDYCYGAKAGYVILDSESIIGGLQDAITFEDGSGPEFSDKALIEIQEFCEEWNAKHRALYWNEDWDILVIIPPEHEMFASHEEGCEGIEDEETPTRDEIY